MFGCKTLIFSHVNEIDPGINNWFLLNKDKKVQFVNQLYIPPDRTPVSPEGKYEEKLGYFMITIYYKISGS